MTYVSEESPACSYEEREDIDDTVILQKRTSKILNLFLRDAKPFVHDRSYPESALPHGHCQSTIGETAAWIGRQPPGQWLAVAVITTPTTNVGRLSTTDSVDEGFGCGGGIR
ncbi:hypothetical protein CVT26_015465 [Gymnopilus dilepis]|uniref:Uncharacterized protein n=1 Tax=Gymnopilus dilepis TaxID=231916 RepID=A0A409WM72_9AGAR|nr:hypothetical protein CVT26_015465 [Gymnopilus dilepis]